jgi:hypothetical protein
MQWKYSNFFNISFAFTLFIFIASCIQTYQPRSQWEQEAFLRTRADVHPYDVRTQFQKHQYIPVRWAGIIQESEFYEVDDAYEVILLIEHRYFDWKVDAMSSPQMYYPSKSGEGLFQTSWYLTKDADLDYFIDRFGSGNMAIVYGLPQEVVDSVVLLRSDYIRIIDRSRFQDDQVDYIPESARNRPVNATSFSNE